MINTGDVPRTNYVGVQAFSSIFRPLSKYVADRIEAYKFEHRELTEEEYNRALLEIIRVVHEKTLDVSGPSRHPVWEKGWGENLANFDDSRSGLELARPKYFNKHPIVRWKGHLYSAESPDYEYNMLAVLQDYLFDKHFRNASVIYEFGCGTGHNLFRAHDVNQKAVLHGFDWAQSAVEFINLMRQHGKIQAAASQFDFFNPPKGYRLAKNSHIYTVAALEQTGSNFKPWVDYILTQKPKLVAHIEPIVELLDPEHNVLDYLCAQYFLKRNYLNGYLNYLKLLVSQGKIILQEVIRTKTGSMFIEGYSVVVWSPMT